MTAQTTFGTMLREARERRGFDLSSAARRLRIRPDILRAIEESDFARMPPRGYARNMVNAYARLVGLNPTEVTRRYLDEAYAYQVGRARSEAQPVSRFDMGGATRREARLRELQEREDNHQPPKSAFGRTLYDDRTDSNGHAYGQARTHPSRHSVAPTTQYTNFYAGPQVPFLSRIKLPYIVAGVVVLVVLLVILFAVFGNRGAASEGSVPDVPITGLTDTSNPTNGADGTVQQTTPVLVAPASVVFTYAVASGNSSYIEVYEGDSESPSVADTVVGPTEKSFDVSTTLFFVTTQPDSVSVMLGGVAITADQLSTTGNGVYTYTVDFPAYLEQWKAENQPADATGATATS